MLAIGCIASAVISCRVDEPEPPEGQEWESFDIKDYHLRGGRLVLGRQLGNSYTVETMQKAWDNLSSAGRVIEDLAIETTDLYVRFLPEDSVDLDVLQHDSTLTLFDHPLDFEIDKDGSWYHDPTIPDHLPTWQYTVVKPDYDFPPVRYEILAELFLADEEAGATNGRPGTVHWEQLEDEALRITGNLEDEEANGRVQGRWRPGGCIMVEENSGFSPSGRVLPVKGVEVRARRFFKWSKGQTDGHGCFSVNKRYRRSVRYSIKWEVVDRYKVSNAWGFARTYNRPGGRTRSYWHPVIQRDANGREVWTEATMANAMHDFHVQATAHHLKTPSSGNKLKVRMMYGNGTSNAINGSFRHNPAYFVLGGIGGMQVIHSLLRNDVRFYVEPADGTPAIYKAMMHELGHMSHILKSGFNFQTTYLVEPMAVESFGMATEYYFMLPYYREYVNSIPEEPEFEINKGGRSWQYTPFFIDLQDTQNQRNARPGDFHADQFADDRVSGYSLEQMQKALDNRTTLRGVQEYLKIHYHNSTEQHIERLRSFYETIKDNKK